MLVWLKLLRRERSISVSSLSRALPPRKMAARSHSKPASQDILGEGQVEGLQLRDVDEPGHRIQHLNGATIPARDSGDKRRGTCDSSALNPTTVSRKHTNAGTRLVKPSHLAIQRERKTLHDISPDRSKPQRIGICTNRTIRRKDGFPIKKSLPPLQNGQRKTTTNSRTRLKQFSDTTVLPWASLHPYSTRRPQ